MRHKYKFQYAYKEKQQNGWVRQQCKTPARNVAVGAPDERLCECGYSLYGMSSDQSNAQSACTDFVEPCEMLGCVIRAHIHA